jgi:hypothetical protein
MTNPSMIYAIAANNVGFSICIYIIYIIIQAKDLKCKKNDYLNS